MTTISPLAQTQAFSGDTRNSNAALVEFPQECVGQVPVSGDFETAAASFVEESYTYATSDNR